MNTKLMKLTESRGVSLVEVLIALFLTAIITTAVFQTYVTQHKNYLVQDDISEIQQNARASIDELTRQLRAAGYELPLGLQFIEAHNTNPDTITLCYKDGNCDSYLAEKMPQPSSELKCATNVSCFKDGQWVYIYEPDSGGGEFFEITHVQDDAIHIQHNTTDLSRCYGKDAIILSIVRIKFYIDNTTDPDHPCLMFDMFGHTPQVYAENVTDLQFRYKLKNGTTVDQPSDVNDVLEVLFNITARSNKPEVGTHGVTNFRTRTYSSEVSLRNRGV
jgi:Tfp pilus assembly protein PilE